MLHYDLVLELEPRRPTAPACALADAQDALLAALHALSD